MRDIDSIANAPEARALAYSKLVAAYDLATDERRRRPLGFDRDLMQSQARLMYSGKWQDPRHHCSLLDPGPAPLGQGPQPVRRETPLSDEGRDRRFFWCEGNKMSPETPVTVLVAMIAVLAAAVGVAVVI